MTRYVAFLRAINVGGRAVVKMTDVRDAFAAAGCRNVRTYIQSGNVVFDLPEAKTASIFQKVRAQLTQLLGHEPGVVVRTLGELEALVKSAPFKKVQGEPRVKLYVAFLGEKPKGKPHFPIRSVKEALEVFGMRDLDVFVVSRPRPGRFYGFPNLLIEKELLVSATTRNWTTVTKVVDFARKEI